MDTITIRPYTRADLAACTAIWNEVVADGVAFPGEELLSETDAAALFAAQDAVGVAVNGTGDVLGLYIVHPNNIGRCGHVANASYCVAGTARGQGVGRRLVPASLRQARALGFRGMQFNAVVKSNVYAIRLYKDFGFHIVGTIPGGFRLKNGEYSDMYVMYRALTDLQGAAF